MKVINHNLYLSWFVINTVILIYLYYMISHINIEFFANLTGDHKHILGDFQTYYYPSDGEPRKVYLKSAFIYLTLMK